MVRLLVIDDSPNLVLKQIHSVFDAVGHEIDTARTGEDGVRQASARTPDAILLDLRLPDLSGLEVYRRLRQLDARIPVIFITATSDTDSAIEATKQGAFDYLFKPLDTQQLRRVVGQALELSRLAREPAEVAETAPDGDRGDAIIGRCPAMLEVYKAIGRVAGQDVPVLITGESGTGKELVARAIYQHECAGPGAVPAHQRRRHPRRAAGDRAVRTREGCVYRRRAAADRQVRAVPRRDAVPRRGRRHVTGDPGQGPAGLAGADVRAGRRQRDDPDRRPADRGHSPRPGGVVGEGKYRPDLYYRLGVFTVHLPPLRERGDDLPMLVQHYVRRFSPELGREAREIGPEAMERLREYPWPGNVRELQSVLKQALLRSTGPVLVPAFLPELGRRTAAEPATAGGAESRLEALIERWLGDGRQDLHEGAHQELDRFLLPRVLRSTEGNQVQAARLLGITRLTLRRRLRELGLSLTKTIEGGEDEAP